MRSRSSSTVFNFNAAKIKSFSQTSKYFCNYYVKYVLKFEDVPSFGTSYILYLHLIIKRNKENFGNIKYFMYLCMLETETK